jgi:predicted transcriptional regulator
MRSTAPPLAPLFRSQMQLELLGLLLLQPDRTWTLDQLATLLNAPASSVHRELGRAVSAGLVRRDDRQRPHLYAAAADSPAYKPLKQLLDLTVGLPERLADALSSVDGIRAAAIHGSWAKGRITPDSDLDVIVVTDGDRSAAQRAVRRVGRQIGRQSDGSVLSPRAFAVMLAEHNPFLEGILRGPRIDVVGDLDELTVA